jgi:hypothetical protein
VENSHLCDAKYNTVTKSLYVLGTPSKLLILFAAQGRVQAELLLSVL